MTSIETPANEVQTLELVQQALADGQTLEVLGAGSKQGWGHPVVADRQVSLTGLRGITLYEPAELVLSAAVGTPLSVIEAALAENSQMLAFEPPDLSHLWSDRSGAVAPTPGDTSGSTSSVGTLGGTSSVGTLGGTSSGGTLGGTSSGGTLGGAMACNLGGPRRPKAGAARDHFLGVSLVTGRGETVKSGGRVVKNVTGYDLCKLMTGSFGTLGIMTAVTVKILPAPEKVRTLLVFGLDPAAAQKAMADALNSPQDVNAAAHLPAGLAAALAIDDAQAAGASVTALRMEGTAVSVAHRCAALTVQLQDLGPTAELHTHRSRVLWRTIGDARPLSFSADGARLPAQEVWRLSVAPTQGPVLVDRLQAIQPHARWFMDWGGGLLWVAGDAGLARLMRDPDMLQGGHATLMVAGASSTLARFQPEPASIAALADRVRTAFDPQGLFNPGRMTGAASGTG